jgi:hypothetical protein
MKLIDPHDGIPIDGIDSPHEFYWVLGQPTPLAGMKYPRSGFPWATLFSVGFKHVVALHPGSYDPAPLTLLFNEPLPDLVSGGPPRNADIEEQLVRSAAKATIEALRSAQGVVIHCVGGRGRTGTVLGCVLREFGYETKATIAYLNRVHRARGKPGWPESGWQGDVVARWNPITA